jgi:hypothetical protein
MKALSLWQPWATLVSIGAKRIETRSWPTKYRGPLAIHAGLTRRRELDLLCLEDGPIRAALEHLPPGRREAPPSPPAAAAPRSSSSWSSTAPSPSSSSPP